MSFQPSNAEPDIFIHLNEEANVYEHIAVYVDVLSIASKDWATIISILNECYNFKLKHSGTIIYHLGIKFFHENDYVLWMNHAYILKI